MKWKQDTRYARARHEHEARGIMPEQASKEMFPFYVTMLS